MTGRCLRVESVRAVDNVSFEVATGEFYALLGPNGAGKTTTLRSGDIAARRRGRRSVEAMKTFLQDAPKLAGGTASLRKFHLLAGETFPIRTDGQGPPSKRVQPARIPP